jgi:hypothetical protein
MNYELKRDKKSSVTKKMKRIDKVSIFFWIDKDNLNVLEIMWKYTDAHFWNFAYTRGQRYQNLRTFLCN